MSEMRFLNIDTRLFTWVPREDITTYELALCMPLFHYAGTQALGKLYDKLPDNAKRHWAVGETPRTF